MKIELVILEDLKSADYNPRQLTKEQHDQLTESIKRFGIVDPLIVNGNSERKNIVIGGHQRLLIAKELGHKDIPVHYVDLSEEKEKELNLRLNKNTGEWNYDALANHFDIDFLKDVGFTEKDLRVDAFNPEVKDDNFKPGGEKPPEPETKKGQLLQLGAHRLMCGDATNPDDLKKLMNGERADMVFSDPPYGVGFEYNKHEDHTDYEKYKEFCFKWLDNIKQFTNFIMLTTGHKNKKLYYEYDNTLNELVWLKRSGNVNGFISYLLHTEPIVAYGKPPNGNRYDTDIFEEPIRITKESKELGHTCPKPVKLIAKIIQPATNRNHTVLDVFGGSGTTMIACQQLERSCYMLEIDPAYCDIIVKRWEKLTGEQAKLIE